jgi:hypothetical protein
VRLKREKYVENRKNTLSKVNDYKARAKEMAKAKMLTSNWLALEPETRKKDEHVG